EGNNTANNTDGIGEKARRGHAVLRELAVQQVHRNIRTMENLMSSRNKRQRLEFDIGDYLRVNIPRVDRTVADLESISAEFPELENIPDKRISLMEAAKMQSSATVTGALCRCKSKCDSNRCPCKRTGTGCGSRCHPSQLTCMNRSN
ncbi:10434_t:CDS:2, partial [Paraglomus brasilianum]